MVTNMKEKETRRGGNCNVEIDRNNGLAKKILRNTSSNEKIERFRTEIKIAELLKDRSDLNIVQIIEAHEEDNINSCYILMKFYEYNLVDLLEKTQANVRKTFQLMLPIIKSLNELSLLESPIFHRDLKPENILSDGERLFLSDFGIAFIGDGGDRKTTTMEAVGARLFLAPEYEVGRVESINEKGDIYSLGKIIWYLINGKKDELLPYNLWFMNEFDLSKKYHDADGIYFANFIIMNCLEINPSRRAPYQLLIQSIERFLASDSVDSNEELENKIEIKFRQNELIRLEQEKRNLSFLSAVEIEIEHLYETIQKSTQLSQTIKNIIGKLCFKQSINYASKNGPVTGLSAYSDPKMIIRVEFKGKDRWNHVTIEFISKKELTYPLYKIKIAQNPSGLTLDDRPFVSGK